MARERSYTRFDLIPASGVGEAAGGVSGAVSDEKIRGNEVERTFNKDMTNDEMTSLRHTNTSSNLEPNV